MITAGSKKRQWQRYTLGSWAQMEYVSYRNKLDVSVVSVEQDKDKENWALKATNKFEVAGS